MDTPHGRRVAWARIDRPAIEDGPAVLPGVIVHELPDDWVLISWPHKSGWYIPDAVYEMKSLRDVSDAEFEQLVREVRDSDWEGLPEPASEPGPRRFAAGDFVQGSGPQPGDPGWDAEATTWIEKALGGGVTPGHPGVVIEADNNSAVRVQWIGKVDSFSGEEFIRDDWVEPVTKQDFERLSQQLRQSDWQGLRHGQREGIAAASPLTRAEQTERRPLIGMSAHRGMSGRVQFFY